MACVFMLCIIMAYTVMPCITTAYTVMPCIVMASARFSLNSWGAGLEWLGTKRAPIYYKVVMPIWSWPTQSQPIQLWRIQVWHIQLWRIQVWSTQLWPKRVEWLGTKRTPCCQRQRKCDINETVGVVPLIFTSIDAGTVNHQSSGHNYVGHKFTGHDYLGHNIVDLHQY